MPIAAAVVDSAAAGISWISTPESRFSGVAATASVWIGSCSDSGS